MRAFWAAAAGLLGLISAPTLAQAQDCEMKSYVPVAGSGGNLAAKEALAGFGKLYGATGAAENEMLPMLRKSNEFETYDDTVGLFHLRWSSIFGAANQLMMAEKPQSNCPNLYNSQYDLHAGSFGLGMRYKSFSVFYVTSTVMGTQSGVWERALGPMFAWIPPGYYWFAAPFLGPWEYEDRGLYIGGDYIAGAQLDVYGTNLAVGYIGTQGIYTNITQEKLRIFLGAALADQFSELAYLKSGLDRLKVYQGLTSAYARKIVHTRPKFPDAQDLPTIPNPSLDIPDPSDLKDVDFWTGHFEQLNIIDLVSFKSALAVAPSVFLHDLSLAIHSDGFYKDPVHDRAPLDDGAASFSIGTVELPENRAVGQSGGRLLSVMAEYRYFGEGRGVGDINLKLSFNDPEILTRFPSARNVFNLSFGGTFSPR